MFLHQFLHGEVVLVAQTPQVFAETVVLAEGLELPAHLLILQAAQQGLRQFLHGIHHSPVHHPVMSREGQAGDFLLPALHHSFRVFLQLVQTHPPSLKTRDGQ